MTKKIFPRFWKVTDVTYEYSGNDIYFGKNHEWLDRGGHPSYEYNQQPILLNGNDVGMLIERVGGRFIDEMEATFIAPVKDGDEGKPNVFWSEEESVLCGICFRTLQEFADYIK